MANNEADAIRNAGVDAAEREVDWALATLVASRTNKQLASKAGSNQAFAAGMKDMVESFRIDMAGDPDAQTMSARARDMEFIVTAASAGDWATGNFVNAYSRYNTLAEADRIADAREAAQAANKKPDTAIKVDGRTDVLGKGLLARELLTSQPITMPKAADQQAPQAAEATTDQQKTKQQPRRRPGVFGLDS